MTGFNFAPREVPMASAWKSHQMKGHAKFADIARLTGRRGLDDFWHHYNSNDTYNVSYPAAGDSKLIQPSPLHHADPRQEHAPNALCCVNSRLVASHVL